MEKMTMTVNEMAMALGIGKNVAYELIKKGRVPALKIGRQIRIPKKSFDDWLIGEAQANNIMNF
jgi:DNA binding domain, excisionase family